MKETTENKPQGGGEEKKLFVKSDEDWKAEAQREKDRLAEKAKAQEARRRLPPPSFAGFIGDLGLQAMLAMGLVAVEGSPQPSRDLEAARYTIDILGVLQEKTRGNLGPEEKRHLDDLVHSLRINFVRAAQLEETESKKVQEPSKKIIT